MSPTSKNYLLIVGIFQGDVPIPLAVYRRGGASPDGVHSPPRVVVVHDVEVPVPATRHPLGEFHAEVVERHSDLHPRVSHEVVAVAQQHHLLVVREEAVRYGHRRGPPGDVDQAVGAVGQRAMVDPDLRRGIHRDPVAVRSSPLGNLRRARPDLGVAGGLAVVDVHVVDNHIRHRVEDHTAFAGYLHLWPASVDRLKATHQQLVFKVDDHVA